MSQDNFQITLGFHTFTKGQRRWNYVHVSKIKHYPHSSSKYKTDTNPLPLMILSDSGKLLSLNVQRMRFSQLASGRCLRTFSYVVSLHSSFNSHQQSADRFRSCMPRLRYFWFSEQSSARKILVNNLFRKTLSALMYFLN